MEKVENHVLQNLCRVCLIETSINHPIFTETIEETYNLNIHNLLTKIVDIQLSDSEFPNIICNTCLQFLIELKKFQDTCLKSDKIIRDHYSRQTLPIIEDVTPEYIKVEMNVAHNSDTSEDNWEEPDDLSENNAKADVDDILNNDKNLDDKKNSDDDDDSSGNESSGEQSTKHMKPYAYYLQKDDSGGEVYACNLCPEKFNKWIACKNHMPSHGPYPFVCNECKKGFKIYRSILLHSKRHSSNMTRYKCELCDKYYVERSSLLVHMRVHRNERPYLCSTCGKCFRQNSELKTHLRVHINEPIFVCNICGKGIRSKSSIKIHMRSHTGERPYLCSKCPKTFISSYRLKMHAIIHTGLKPFTCPICQKSFNRKFTLGVHVKGHSKERPHICLICDKRFTQAHTLRSHMLIHEREKN